MTQFSAHKLMGTCFFENLKKLKYLENRKKKIALSIKYSTDYILEFFDHCFQASTSEMYGKVAEIPQSETTPFHPRSPYGMFIQWNA